MFEFFGAQRVSWRQLMAIAERTYWDSGRSLFEVNAALGAHPCVEAMLEQLCCELSRVGLLRIQEFNEIFARVCLGDASSWGDKTPDYGFHMCLLSSLWPDCRFLHVVRDGLDTARSMKSHSGCQMMESNGFDNWCSLSFGEQYRHLKREELPLERFVASWRRRLMRIRDEAGRLREGQYREIRYERLAADPRGVMAEVADWLELHLDEAWLAGVSGRLRIPRQSAALGDLVLRLGPEDLLMLNVQKASDRFTLEFDVDEFQVYRELEGLLSMPEILSTPEGHWRLCSCVATLAMASSGRLQCLAEALMQSSGFEQVSTADWSNWRRRLENCADMLRSLGECRA